MSRKKRSFYGQADRKGEGISQHILKNHITLTIRGGRGVNPWPLKDLFFTTSLMYLGGSCRTLCHPCTIWRNIPGRWKSRSNAILRLPPAGHISGHPHQAPQVQGWLYAVGNDLCWRELYDIHINPVFICPFISWRFVMHSIFCDGCWCWLG